MIRVPEAEALALAGIGFVILFALWTAQIAPRLARGRRAASSSQ